MIHERQTDMHPGDESAWPAVRGMLGLIVWMLFGVGVMAGGAQTPPRASLMLQLGHAFIINSVAYSPDGRYVLTGSADKTAQLWDASTGLELRSFEGHSEAVRSVAYSPDGRTVLTGSWDHTARIWEATTGRLVLQIVTPSAVESVAFSGDGREVVTGNRDNVARLWDTATGRQLQQYAGQAGQIDSVAFSPDGQTLLTGSWDKTARLWNTTSGAETRRFDCRSVPVMAVAFSPNGRTALTGCNDGMTRLWDVSSGKELLRFGSRSSITAASFSPDGRSVLTSSNDGVVRLWDALTGSQVREFSNQRLTTSSVAFSPGGQTFVSGGWDHVAHLWELSSGRELRRFEGHSDRVIPVAFAPDGQYLLTGTLGGPAQLWDLASGKASLRLVGHTRQINSVAFSPDSRYALTGSDDASARLWNLNNGAELRRVDDQSREVHSVAFSPDGHLLLTGTGDDDYGAALLWDADTGRELRQFNDGDSIVRSVAFAPDGQSVLIGTTPAQLWDAKTASRLRTVEGHPDIVTSVAFSPDGRRALSGKWGGTVELSDPATGRVLRQFAGHTAIVFAIAFSPDGRTALTGSQDGTARLWEVESGKELQRFDLRPYEVYSVAFSRDGGTILTGSQDGAARLWDAATGKELASLISFTGGGWAVVDPDGRFDTNELDGDAPLHWVVDDDPMRALPLEIFMRDYYTPRLLARILNRESFAPVRSISRIQNRVQPEVTVSSATASGTQPGRADVVVRAASHTNEKGINSGLQDLRLFRNGQLVGYREGVLKDGEFTFSNIQLPRSATTVKFTAYAFNSERIKSVTAEMSYAYRPTATARPRAWLLQIGVNHYEATDCELQFSVNDAGQLNKALEQRLAARGLDVHAVQLVSTAARPGATKIEIRKALESIAADATPDDVFFLSFSGHGYSSPDGHFYILPSDVRGSCSRANAAFLGNAISSDELAYWLRPIDAGEMTFVLDSCYSAQSVEANDFKPGPMGSRGLGQLAYDKRMRILAASQSDETAGEYVALGSGLLSYVLTHEGLVEKKADWKPVDHKITVGEWLSYAADAVPKFDQGSTAGKDAKGARLDGAPALHGHSAQIPAVFDFSRSDIFVLQ